MGPTLADLLLDTSGAIEAAFRRGITTCPACREDLESLFMDNPAMPGYAYALGCEKHVPYYRALQEPDWLTWVRRERDRMHELERVYSQALNVAERMTKGLALLDDPDLPIERRKAYERRLDELRGSLSEAFRLKGCDELKQSVSEFGELAVYYTQLLERAVSWAAP